jgi:hypothetical protein
MPRFSWSLAAALSMSAIAAFRPEIGSKSLAAHAARGLTRVVESIAQRFQSSPRVAPDTPAERESHSVGSGRVQSEGVPVSTFASADQSFGVPVDSERQIAATHVGDASFIADVVSGLPVETNLVPSKYSSPPAAFFASLKTGEGVAAFAARHTIVRDHRAPERSWKDCAVAAICSGIPGPASLRSTPQALGKPPSV